MTAGTAGVAIAVGGYVAVGFAFVAVFGAAGYLVAAVHNVVTGGSD